MPADQPTCASDLPEDENIEFDEGRAFLRNLYVEYDNGVKIGPKEGPTAAYDPVGSTSRLAVDALPSGSTSPVVLVDDLSLAADLRANGCAAVHDWPVQPGGSLRPGIGAIVRGQPVVLLLGPIPEKDAANLAAQAGGLLGAAGASSVGWVRWLPPAPKKQSDLDVLIDRAKSVVLAGPGGWKMTIENAASFCAPGLVEPAAVIDGLLRLTEVGQIAAPPKTHKSHLAIQLSLCVATGRDFLGHPTVKGKVMLIDNECLPGTVKRRLLAIAAALRLGDEWKANLDVVCLRGHTMPVDLLARNIQLKVQSGTYALIVLDALYRAYPEGFVENDNGCWVELHNALTQWSEKAGSAFLGILHTSKGNQANKSVTDIGAGGGAQSRAADCHMALREHEDEDRAVLEAAVRSWPKQPLRGLVFQYPLWHEAPEIDTAKLKGAAPLPKTRTKDMSPDEFVSAYLTEEPQARGLVEARAMAGGMRQAAVRVMVGSLIQAKVVHVWTRGLSTVPEPTTATFLGQLKAWRAEHPDGTRAAAVEALSVARTRVYDLWAEASP